MNIRYFKINYSNLKIEASRLEGAKHDFARDWEHLNPVSRYHLNLAVTRFPVPSLITARHCTQQDPTNPLRFPTYPSTERTTPGSQSGASRTVHGQRTRCGVRRAQP
jgi:hypothetical protein